MYNTLSAFGNTAAGREQALKIIKKGIFILEI